TLQRAMNDAFQSNDKAVIKKLAAPDQTAVTPFSSGVVTIGKALQQLGELKIEIVRSGEMKVTQLGPGAMMVGQEISYSGDVGGNPIPTPVYATGIWTKIDGKWRQKFYQETVLE
ncbi:MAG: nuclear transport factor 2 family protein, partial [Hyphomicrobiaceae bacterium]